MPRNSKNRRSAKKKKHSVAEKRPSRTSGVAARAARPLQGGAVEPTSGSESSPLDPKRKAISVPDEFRLPVTSGQLSGDAQGLPQEELDDSESVEELVEEGQDLEGELVQGVENAPPADQGDVRTHAPPQPEDRTPAYKNRNRL